MMMIYGGDLWKVICDGNDCLIVFFLFPWILFAQKDSKVWRAQLVKSVKINSVVTTCHCDRKNGEMGSIAKNYSSKSPLLLAGLWLQMSLMMLMSRRSNGDWMRKWMEKLTENAEQMAPFPASVLLTVRLLLLVQVRSWVLVSGPLSWPSEKVWEALLCSFWVGWYANDITHWATHS